MQKNIQHLLQHLLQHKTFCMGTVCVTQCGQELRSFSPNRPPSLQQILRQAARLSGGPGELEDLDQDLDEINNLRL